MPDKNGYKFANLEPSLVAELVQMEERMKQELGEPVTLIAYTASQHEDANESCRPEPNE